MADIDHQEVEIHVELVAILRQVHAAAQVQPDPHLVRIFFVLKRHRFLSFLSFI